MVIFRRTPDRVSFSRMVNSVSAVTVTDQAWVSGCNFVSGIVLVRTLGLEGYGNYVLLYAALQYLNTFCGALILSPMMSLVPLAKDGLARRRLLRGAFGWQCLLSGLLSLIAYAGGTGYKAVVADWQGAEAVVPFSLAVFAFQLQDYLRRHHFVRQRPILALRSDVVAYGGMVAAIGVMSLSDRLDVEMAFSIIAVAFGGAALIDVFFERLLPTRAALVEAFHYGRHAARDYLLAWQLTWLASQGILFVGASVLGAQGAGAVRAAQILMGPLNVVYQALDNLLPVWAANAYRTRGLVGLQTELWRVFVRVGTPLSATLLLLALFAAPLMRGLYGDSYEPFAVLIVWQSLYFALQYVLRFLQVFHRALNDTRAIVQSSAVSACTALLTAAILVPYWREAGVVASWCVAWAVTIGFLGVLAQRRSRRQS